MRAWHCILITAVHKLNKKNIGNESGVTSALRIMTSPPENRKREFSDYCYSVALKINTGKISPDTGSTANTISCHNTIISASKESSFSCTGHQISNKSNILIMFLSRSPFLLYLSPLLGSGLPPV